MRLFKFIVAVALLAGSLLIAAPPTATALPQQEYDCHYYSDASYTVEVGWSALACNGSRSQGGVFTPYAICYYESCDLYDPRRPDEDG